MAVAERSRMKRVGWPPPHDGADLPRDGWKWSDFSSTVFDFARVLASTWAQTWPRDTWEFWEKPWLWDNAHELWEKLGEPRGTEPAWPRFVHALDTNTVDEALAQWGEAGGLVPLWWEDDAEWSLFIKALVAAGYRYMASYDVPVLIKETGALSFRWAFDDQHAVWVALGRPNPEAPGWAEFVSAANPWGPVKRKLRVVK